MKKLIAAITMGVMLFAVPVEAAWMQIYVRNRAVHEDNKRILPRQNDIYSVKPAGFDYHTMAGVKEKIPPIDGGHFVWIEINNRSAPWLRKFMRRWSNETESKRYRLNRQDMPPLMRTTLREQGWISRSWENIRPYVFDKEDNVVVPDL